MADASARGSWLTVLIVGHQHTVVYVRNVALHAFLTCFPWKAYQHFPQWTHWPLPQQTVFRPPRI